MNDDDMERMMSVNDQLMSSILGAPTATEVQLKMAHADAAMNAAQGSILGAPTTGSPLVGAPLGQTTNWPQQSPLQVRTYPTYDPYPVQPYFLLRFREIEGGYIASFSFYEGEIAREVLCPTLDDVAKLIPRMVAEKAMK